MSELVADVEDDFQSEEPPLTGIDICSIFSPLAHLIFPLSPKGIKNDVKGDMSSVGSTTGPDEYTLIARICVPAPENSDELFLANFEMLLDGFGIECVIFLKCHRSSKWFKISGKRCTMRSKIGFKGLEFRIRSTAEMKKLRFDWDSVTEVETSQSSTSYILPLKFRLIDGENINDCFMKMVTLEKGEIQVAFKSQKLRDACLRGFRLMMQQRKKIDSSDDANTASNSSKDKLTDSSIV